MANIEAALLRYCRINVGWRRLAVNPVRKGRGWDEQIKVPAGQKILEYGEYQRKRPVFPSGILPRIGLTISSWFRWRDRRQYGVYGGFVH